MNYEIVTLPPKKVVGIEARTNNGSPDMTSVIGGLWNRFYGQGIYSAIKDKANGKGLGIYTDYAGNETGDYTIMTACEVEKEGTLPEGTKLRTLPGGSYGKFVVRGDLHKAIKEFWEELWNMELPRAFAADFEEYQNSDEKNAEIHVYISLKES